MTAIHDYYEQLAPTYDQNRFGNSYGRYIDAMERAILCQWLAGVPAAEVIDIGCGTGRLLNFAQTGVDVSDAMLQEAARKFADRRLVRSQLPDLSELFEADPSLPAARPVRQFQVATCFHVFMHLSPQVIAQSLQTLAALVRPGGSLIVDLPSLRRRSLRRVRASSTPWHANTVATTALLQEWAGPEWKVIARRGILFLPIHRLPSRLRAACQPLDTLLCNSPLADWASYHVYQLQRQPVTEGARHDLA